MSVPVSDTRNPVDQPGFGQALRALRESRDVSKAELARRTEVDPSHITRLEQSERGVSRDLVEKLSHALDANRREHLDLLQASGFLAPGMAEMLNQPDLARLAALLAGPVLAPEHRAVLERQVRLALDVAIALGYPLPDPNSND